MKTIKIKNKRGESLVGVLEGALSSKLFILCHGLADTKDNPAFEFFSEALSTIAPVFRFDFSGNGESKGRFERATYHKEVEDLRCVIDHFKRLGVKSVCLVGHSMGGGVCQYFAHQDGAIKALVTIGGVSRADSFQEKFSALVAQIEAEGKAFLWREKYGERFPMTKEYLDSASSIDILSAAEKTTVPVLALHGDGDSAVRERQTREWLSRLPHDEWCFEVVAGCDHFFNRFKPGPFFEEALARVEKILVPWAREHF